MTREFYYFWQWELESTPEALWPLVSDTNRFNRDAGLPPMKIMGLRDGIYRLRYKVPLVVFEWDEEPFEWTYSRSFGILRKFHRGPLKEMRTLLTLETRQPTGSLLKYQVWARPANLLGLIGIPFAIGLVSARRFGNVFHNYDRILKRGKGVAEGSRRRRLSPGGRSRLKSAQEALHTRGVDPAQYERLVEFLNQADDLSVQRMRPFVLADNWGSARRPVLEMFLHATRLGLLDMYWELLCPRCRRMAESMDSLSEVKVASHCNTCKIDFRAQFDHNVEVIFRPNPSVRTVDGSVKFCVSSPQYQPHIVMSQQVSALRETLEYLQLEPGRYNLRASNVPGMLALRAHPEGPAESILRVTEFGWPDEEQTISVEPGLKLVNATESDQTFQLERFAWSDQAATAADVTVLQVFRDLFASEVLRPGEEISIGSLTLVFTDLYESTRLYQKIGDAPAFGRVQEHFVDLEKAVSLEGGSIVKTMGDAVMASFREPVSALRAVWQAQQAIARYGEPLLQIKIGIHHGPCIVVNLNERLDYFGSMVNIAARLTEFSAGGEIVLSETVYSDDQVQAWVKENLVEIEKFEADIKGFDEPVPVWKVKV
ncbi:MAG: adenylate/guanylate cyclase domain-containing protein [Anaerolineales bacterium]|nr:adenylate/guanylate cyclase domain-containing protein [Anaerolineales bacterium]